MGFGRLPAIGILGVNTDTDADLQVVNVEAGIGKAVELQSSTSDYNAVDFLVHSADKLYLPYHIFTLFPRG